MLYSVYIQGKLYKSVEANYTHEVLNQITADLQNDRVPGRDPAKAPRIVIRPAHLPPPSAADLEELFTPATPPMSSADHNNAADPARPRLRSQMRSRY